VAVVDTTGAGDLFHAGFAYGLLKGWTRNERWSLAARGWTKLHGARRQSGIALRALSSACAPMESAARVGTQRGF